MKLKILLFMSIVMVFTASSLLANPVIFSNPLGDLNNTLGVNSTNQDGQDWYKCYTDYYYDNSYIMTDFHWWGWSITDTPYAFIVSYYENNNDLPGSQVYSQFVDYGDANAELIDGSDIVYKYSIDFDTPSYGVESGLYWISVQALSISPATSWYWATGVNDHWNEDLQWDYGSSDWTGYPGPDYDDFAFEITGFRDVVPEPTTLTLFGLGLLGSALARRRRNKK